MFSTTVYYPVYGIVHIKDSLLIVGKCSHEVVAEGFFSHYLSGP